MGKNTIITIIIILAVILLAILILFRSTPETDKELTKCIGSKSVLYTQLGCHACESQEKMFGDNLQYLNIIDCFYDRTQCEGITGTPTWIINGEAYKGVQNIDRLKELTGC